MTKSSDFRARLLAGVIALASGVFVVWLGVGSDHSGQNAPTWVVIVTGLVLALAGLAAIVQAFAGDGEKNAGNFVAVLFLAIAMTGMAMIPAWIAFGPGERRSGMHVSGLPSFLPRLLQLDLARWAFGFGAVLMVLVAFLIWSEMLKPVFAKMTWKPMRVTARLLLLAAIVTAIASPVLRRDSSAAGRSGHDPVVHVLFNGDYRDHGPYALEPEANGDELGLVPGRSGQGLFVGGSKDWIDYPLPPDIDLSKSVTVAGWVKREDWTNPNRNGSSSQVMAAVGPFVLELSVTNRATGEPASFWTAFFSKEKRSYHTVFVPKGVVGGYGVSGDDTLAAGVWAHLAVVYLAGSDVARVYLDGKMVGERNVFVRPVFAEDQRLRIGTWSEDNLAFRGVVDEVQVFDYALTEKQIKELVLLKW